MTNRPKITDSKLALWRSAIAIAHADGKITNSERALLHEFLEAHNFSAAQMEIIDNDLYKGVSLDDVFDGITDKRDRAHLINFGRILVNIDGDFHDAERKIMEYITDFHAKAINLPQVLNECRRDARRVYNKFLEEKYAQQRKEQKQSSLILKPFEYLYDDLDNKLNEF